ncbi:amidase signature enzyme [Melanomma pulvis-pyrius CBS 109.77]|uniref:Amidase signature enzyme n=1 Tax=Melanomma pulvis-pyrius CBS 109.77 TaxID=1314802 RepID=A0A6A6XCN5_9PLEO|nr:amidase signature enzyme [Melanomma pulvis-pyrius CBS 109.77]
MATFGIASNANKQKITIRDVEKLTRDIGVDLPEHHKEEWRELIASVQDSIDIVQALPDYVPEVDLQRFPRENVHRPEKSVNPGNAWAWRATIEGDSEGPLKGVTFCLKDNICVKDVPMLVGTDVFTDYIPDVDATVVTRILEAGGTIEGKAVCENLSLCAASFSAATGPVENPFAKGYTSGGSSSGCGSLVGAGIVDAGIGGDQGGSIRFPASYCGLVGMKPTWGLVPWTGMMTHDPVMDTTGPMTKGVALNAKVLQAIAGRDGIDDRQFAAPLPDELPNYSESLYQGVKGLKIGILKEGFQFETTLDPRVREKVLEAANLFQTLGAEVIEISVPLHSVAGHIVNCALRPAAAQQAYLGKACGRRGVSSTKYATLSSWMNDTADSKHMFSASKFSLLSGQWIWSQHPTLYGKAMNLYRRLQDEYSEALGKVDVLIMPTTPYVAKTHPPTNADPVEQMEKSRGVAINTVAFNASGHPAMNLPIGMLPAVDGDHTSEEIRLPVGMQIVGAMFQEQKMYRVAAAWEHEFDWQKL